MQTFRRSLKPWAALALASLLVPSAAIAQEELPGVFTEVIEVRVVNVEAVVTDKDGNRVYGLTPQDFELVVDGQTVPVAYFTEIRGGKALELSAAKGSRKDASGAVERPQVPPSLAGGENVGTSYLVFIDELFALARDRNRVLRRLMDQLPLLGPEDRMAVVAFDGRKLDMLSSWASAGPQLERALRDAIFRPALGLYRRSEEADLEFDVNLSSLRAFDQRAFQDNIGGSGSLLDPGERAFALRRLNQLDNVVSAATATLRGFASPPGRRVMLLLSGGWPSDPIASAAMDREKAIFEPGADQGGPSIFRRLADTANILGYTLYPVDVVGLDGDAVVTADHSVPPSIERNLEERLAQPRPDLLGFGVGALGGNLGSADGQAAVLTRDDYVDSYEHETLAFLAVETGGKALINAQRDVALEHVVSDTRSYYWMGFVPDGGGDDQRHNIRVRVKRPGLSVRSREGFLHATRKSEMTMMAESALLFGNPPSSKQLPVEMGEPRKGLRSMELPVTLAIPMDSVTMLPVGESGYRAQLELRVASLDQDGRRSEIPVVSVELSGDAEPEPGSVSFFEATLKLSREPQDLVLALYDPLSGEILSANLEVRP